MLQIQNGDLIALQCKLCNKQFGTLQHLERHGKRKIPCNRILKCDKCNKEFNQLGDLKKHQARKTPCEPIQGDPTIRVSDDTCIYCRRVFKSKYNVIAHHNICKIKNGGMEILFSEVKRLAEIVKKLEPRGQKEVSVCTTNNIETQNNHFGHTFNFNFINFGEGTGVIENILNTEGVKLLSEKFTKDIPRATQISNRVIDLIGLVFRNPDHKELQGVYVLDLSKTKENAYYHEDGNWILTDWLVLRAQLLQKLHNCLTKSAENKRQDIEKIIKYIFVLGDCGDCSTVEKLSPKETLRIYNDIGEKLKFKTIYKI
jgi:hypothetical protein